MHTLFCTVICIKMFLLQIMHHWKVPSFKIFNKILTEKICLIDIFDFQRNCQQKTFKRIQVFKITWTMLITYYLKIQHLFNNFLFKSWIREKKRDTKALAIVVLQHTAKLQEHSFVIFLIITYIYIIFSSKGLRSIVFLNGQKLHVTIRIATLRTTK